MKWNHVYFAMGSTGALAVALVVAACSSDSNPVQASSMNDASTDSSSEDATLSEPDSGKLPENDAEAQVPDAGKCTAFDASALDAATVASGRDFAANVFRCGQCHQSTGVDAGLTLSGRLTSLSDAGPIFPPNLTPDPATGLGCWTNAQIANAILKGIDDQGATLCVMPRFGQAPDGGAAKMDAGTASEIVAFLRSLPPVTNQVHETVCPATADAGTDAGTDAAP